MPTVAVPVRPRTLPAGPPAFRSPPAFAGLGLLDALPTGDRFVRRPAKAPEIVDFPMLAAQGYALEVLNPGTMGRIELGRLLDRVVDLAAQGQQAFPPERQRVALEGREAYTRKLRQFVEQGHEGRTFLCVARDRRPLFGAPPVVAAGLLRPSPDDPGVGRIERMYCDPAHQGQKLACAILRYLLAQARAAGYHELVLESCLPASRTFYEKFGFAAAPKPDAPHRMRLVL